MRWLVEGLGLRLCIEFGLHEEEDTSPGDVTSSSVGFNASYGDQRWEKGPGDGQV